MKQTLLFFLAFIIAISVAAQSPFATFSGQQEDLKVKQVQSHPGQVNTGYNDPVIVGSRFDNTIIGTTWYDSQTQNYGNCMQRMWYYPDGTVGATWQCSGQGGNPDRGTAYSYFNGTEWKYTDGTSVS